LLPDSHDGCIVCFNIFDVDRNGTIEGEELNRLMEILHEDSSQTSNLTYALKSFDLNDDGRIDFEEFKELNHKFPALLYPVFRIQANMRLFTMGDKWWTLKIEQLIQEKDDELAKADSFSPNSKNISTPIESQEEKDRKAAEAKKKRRQEQAVRIKMGCVSYYLCPCRRHHYLVKENQQQKNHSDSDSDSEAELEKKKKALALKKQNASTMGIVTGNGNGTKGNTKKNGNIVKFTAGTRKPLTQEERLERAKKRRMRDMQDRPSRKN
jgi:sphingosine kinase/serine/threonine-protein phosphatase 2B regulatory subunit